MDINSLNQVKTKSNVSQVSPGDMVKVSYRVKEANKERLQILSGLVIKVRRKVGGGNFTIRRVTHGVGVEHTFPFASPLLDKIEVVRHGKVRRAKLYYMRELSTKEARLKERREKMVERAVAEEVGEAEEIEEATGVEEAEEVYETEETGEVGEAGETEESG